MSEMIHLKWGQLQRHYAGKIETPESEKQRIQKQKDANAWNATMNAKREARLAKQAKRDEKHINPHQELEILESNPTKDVDIKKIVDEAKSKTNVLARQYGLPEPNNPEALARDRLHCLACDRELHSPDAHKRAGLGGLFDDAEVRILCCWCFGRFGDEKIQTMTEQKGDADKRIRLAVYDPVEFCKEEIEYMTDLRRIQIKSKIKRFDAMLVGKVKHDNVEDADWMENCVKYNAKTRYTACNSA